MRRSIATLVLAGLLTLACSSTTSPSIGVDGNWQGTAAGQTLAITMASSGNSVSGTGTISASGSSSYAVTISGTYVVPTLAIALASTGHPSIGLAATVGHGQMSGALNGGGFSDVVIVLNKQ